MRYRRDLETEVVNKKTLRELEHVLPDFVNSCRDDTDVVITHPDSLAAEKPT